MHSFGGNISGLKTINCYCFCSRFLKYNVTKIVAQKIYKLPNFFNFNV